MQMDTPSQLSKTTLILHWIVAITVISLLAVGIYMEETDAYSLYPWHKSFGFLIFFVILARVLWRIKNGWPVPVGQYQRWETLLAKVVHYVLIISTVLMPLSGFLVSAYGGSGVDVFGIEIVARNTDPENPMKSMPHNKELATFAHETHGLVGYVLIGAVLLHIAGALKHHVMDKDGTLRRILGSSV